MRIAIFVAAAGMVAVLDDSGGAAVLAAPADEVMRDSAQSGPTRAIGAAEISDIVRGKICVTGQGAKFTFTQDGHYAYDGLWKNSGHYSVGDGAIVVELDSGLERSFAVFRRRDGVYMENTAITCSEIH